MTTSVSTWALGDAVRAPGAPGRATGAIMGIIACQPRSTPVPFSGSPTSSVLVTATTGGWCSSCSPASQRRASSIRSSSLPSFITSKLASERYDFALPRSCPRNHRAVCVSDSHTNRNQSRRSDSVLPLASTFRISASRSVLNDSAVLVSSRPCHAFMRSRQATHTAWASSASNAGSVSDLGLGSTSSSSNRLGLCMARILVAEVNERCNACTVGDVVQLGQLHL